MKSTIVAKLIVSSQFSKTARVVIEHLTSVDMFLNVESIPIDNRARLSVFFIQENHLLLCMNSLHQPKDTLIFALDFLSTKNKQENKTIITELVNEIRGPMTVPWTVFRGYEKYLTYCARNQIIPCVGVFHLTNDLDKLTSHIESNISKTTSIPDKDTFTKAIIDTQQWRKELILSFSTLDSEYATERFEGRLLEENNRLFHSLCINQESLRIPKIIEEFDDILDIETKQFIISSVNVESYAKSMLVKFDYSLPASGIWKAMERELNVSIIWFLRYIRNLVSMDPWKPIRHRSEEVTIWTKGKKVNLNCRDKINVSFLRGLMLGEIAHILLNGRNNGMFKDINGLALPIDLSHYIKKELAHQIIQVSEFRNKHAHIEAMAEDKYSKLYELIMEPDNTPEISVLGKILLFKRIIRKKISG